MIAFSIPEAIVVIRVVTFTDFCKRVHD